MDRYRSLLRETWWLWIVLTVFAGLMSLLVSPIFWLTVPISLITFLWFGFVRYDEHGNFRGS